jgi:hypothetical protein
MKALLISLIVLAVPVAAQAPVAVGVNSAVRNQVSMQTWRDAALRPAVLREAVFLNTQIANGPASLLQVLLRDQSVFTVGANARMVIDKFVYDPQRGSGDVAASVARGAFRFMSGKALGRNSTGGGAAVRTPVASIGVRGTIVEGAVGEEAIATLAGQPGVPQGGAIDPQTATLVALRGPGPRAQGLDKPGAIDVTSGGRTVTIDRPGYAVFVPGPGQPPLGPFLLGDGAFERLSSFLRTSPAGNADTGVVPIGSAAVAAADLRAVADFGSIAVYRPQGSTELPATRAVVACDPNAGRVCPP